MQKLIGIVVQQHHTFPKNCHAIALVVIVSKLITHIVDSSLSQGAASFKRLAIIIAMRTLFVAIKNSSVEVLLNHALRLASHDILLRSFFFILIFA